MGPLAEHLVDLRSSSHGETFLETILQRIGNTPLVRIRNLASEFPGVEILAKAEWFNPGGSVKDRPAIRMIEDAERSGELTKNKVILDSSSGNMAVSYSMIGGVKGYQVKMVVPGNISQSHLATIRSFGTKVIFSDPLEGSDGAIRLAHSIFEEDPDRYFMPDQYNNPSNWKAHYDTTAVEIWEQTRGHITHLVAGVGTSGTLTGTARGLKKTIPDLEVIGVEPDHPLHGLEGLKYINESIVPGIYDNKVLDRTIFTKTEDGYKITNLLATQEGLFVGSSSGAAMVAALQVAREIHNGLIVVIFPDGGIRSAIERKKILED